MDKERGRISREGRNLRKQAARRMKDLARISENENESESMRSWARQQYADINEASATSTIRGKSTSEARQAVSNLQNAIEVSDENMDTLGRSFRATQHQLNLGSSKLTASVYSETDVHIFYRATQKIWQRGDVDEHARNEAIVAYFNDVRYEKGLSPLRLDEIVDYVLQGNEVIQRALAMDPEEVESELTDEEYAFYEAYMNSDNDDVGHTSPASGIDNAVVSGIREALDELFVLPNPTAI